MPTLRASLAAIGRLCGLLALLIVALASLYAFAAAIGAMIPRNAAWREPDGGIPVFLRSNGVHVDIVLPARAAGISWYPLLPPRDIAEPARAGGWIAFGWGQRDFYLETPAWSDLSPRTALRAILGGDALMHITHLSRPRPGPDIRPLRLAPAAYRRLARSIAAQFHPGGGGRPRLLPNAAYGPDDAFYDARGHYSALDTSNQWTADRLAEAGVRIGVWTPLANGILWRFPEQER